MKISLALTLPYLRRHWKQQLAFSMAICLFSTIILVTLFLCQCFVATNNQLAYEYYGSFGGQTLLADAKTSSALAVQKEELGLSVIPTYGKILTDSQQVYLGYMDQAGQTMRAVRIKEGRPPQTNSELAMDETAYYRLGIEAKLGEIVTLSIQGRNGVQRTKFLFTGIYYDYADHWNKMAQNILLQVNEVGETDPRLPAVLVGAPLDMEPLSYTIMYPEGISPMKGDENYLPNYEVDSARSYAQQLNGSSAVMLFLLGSFFFLLSIFGMWLVSYMTWKSRCAFINSLFGIGITSKQTRNLYLLQALITSSLAWIMSIPLSLLIIWITVHSVSWQGTSIQLDISILPVFITGLLIILSTVGVFLLQNHRNCSWSTKTNRIPKMKKKSVENITDLWKKIEKLSMGGRRISILLLCMGCVFVVGFGLFSGETAAATHFYSSLEARGTVDYYLYVEQGAASLDMLNAGLPRDMGLTKSELVKLQSSPDIEFLCAYTDQLMLPAFLRVRTSETQDDQLLEWAKDNCFEEDNNPYDDETIAQEIMKAKARFGYDADDLLVVKPPIIAVDLQTMKNLLSTVSLEMTQEAQHLFLEGEIAYSASPDFKKDAEIFVTMPIIPTGSTSTTLNGAGTVADFTMRIAEMITLPPNMFGSSQVFPYGNQNTPCIFISYEAISKKDPQLRLFSVGLNDKGTEHELSSKTAHRAAAISKGMGISDRKEDLESWSETQQRERIPIYILMFVFLVIMSGATWIINRLRIMEQIKSFSLLCVLGLTKQELKRRFIIDNIKTILIGEALGLVLVSLADGYLILRYPLVPLLSISVTTVLPYVMSVCLLLAFASYVSCVLAFRKVQNMTDLSLVKNIIE